MMSPEQRKMWRDMLRESFDPADWYQMEDGDDNRFEELLGGPGSDTPGNGEPASEPTTSEDRRVMSVGSARGVQGRRHW